ncbi:MAG: transposase [Pseudomonadota bacterium]
MGKKYTGEIAKKRKEKQAARWKHIQAINDNQVLEELPEILLPEIFNEIKEVYWASLKSIPDPRRRDNRVYPLHLILHRIISGFIEGNKYIGVLFPKKRMKTEPGKKKLGALPTRKVVYNVLRKIDWNTANEMLAPLWDRLGYTPDLVVRREFRNPRVILDEFHEGQNRVDAERREKISAERKAEERSKGMSAAKAKRPAPSKPRNHKATQQAAPPEKQKGSRSIKIQHDLLVDGKVVKASYNAGVTERFVHVTEVRADDKDNRRRFIIGAHPTELDRNGEWGAALCVLDALTPLPGDKVVVVSGDAGFCVEEFCEWLTAKGFFFYLFRIKENAGKIYSRVLDWAEDSVKRCPEGHYRQDGHLESDEIQSRSLWRLPGLRHAVYPGIQEGFVIHKTNLVTGETDRQYFITNRPPEEWCDQSVINRILLHWDTETGVFGVKDNTFHEDKVRYKSIQGARGHVATLNIAWNCLSAPIFDGYWQGEPMSHRIQFWKDHPEFNPLRAD